MDKEEKVIENNNNQKDNVIENNNKQKDNVIENNNNQKDNTDDLKDKINMILRQTDYTENEAIDKLKEFDNDYILVIKNYLGINKKSISKPVNSVNQEIYKQLRYKLDSDISDYNKKKGDEIVKLI